MAQIKKDTSLRKAILQAAITGQLISNVEGESLPLAPASKLSSATPSAGASPATPPETGKQLLDRIIEERNKKLFAEWEEALKKNPKAKMPAPVVASEIDEEGIPFEIPENWCWCRLGDIISLLSGQDFPPEKYSDVEESTPYITGASNIENNHVIINRWTKYPTVISKKQDILLVCKGSGYGKVVIADFDEAHIARQFMAIRTSNLTLRDWIFLYLQNKFSYFKTQGNGLIPGIARNVVLDLLIPLPPLAVQNAIVAKLEQVLPLVDAYENVLLQKEALKSALPDKVKKAILQEAITGQLTEAWRKSAIIKESGKQLLDRIIEERNAKALAEWKEALKKNPKAKKPLAVVASEIEEDEIPFEVPESWCWVKGKNVFAPMESIKPQGETFTYIDTDAVNNKLNIIDNPKNLLVKDAPSRASRKLHKGDVLFSMVRPYLKNIAFVEDAFADAIASTGFYVMTQIGMYNPKFLYYMVLSPYVIDGLHYFMKGDNSPSINTTDVDNFVYPLPPLEEQAEIVKKVEELLPLCK